MVSFLKDELPLIKGGSTYTTGSDRSTAVLTLGTLVDLLPWERKVVCSQIHTWALPFCLHQVLNVNRERDDVV